VKEIFLPFRSPTPPLAQQVRSTVILNGMQTLRAHGVYSRYVDLIAPDSREALMALVAGEWISIDLAAAHYRAAERLGLDTALVESFGAEVADRLYKTVLSSIPALSKKEGVTPWSAYALAHQNTDVNWRGSDAMVVREGPRQALYEWAGQPLAAIPYFVRSFGGFMRALCSLFCAKATYRLVDERCNATTISVRLTWV
jgi:hypothetical protein